MKALLILVILASHSQKSLCQEAASAVKWHKSAFPFEFIENVGQFDNNINQIDTIQFAAFLGGLQIYFTPRSLIYRVDIKSEKQLKIDGNNYPEDDVGLPSLLPQQKKEDGKNRTTAESHFLTIEWLGCNPSVEIIPQYVVPNYYTFPKKNARTASTAKKAFACKKILYKNMYPHIDVEYFFVEGKEGFKYNILLHPGADVSRIKMRHHGNPNLRITENGDIKYQLANSFFTEYHPVSYDDRGGDIDTKFKIEQNVVSFQLATHDPTRLITIDPWVINPFLTVVTDAYVIHHDHEGNAYTLGGVNQTIPFYITKYVHKISPDGATIWSFLLADPTTMNGVGDYRPDITINEKSGETYVITTMSRPNEITKLDSAGIPDFIYQEENDSQVEFWRLSYNHCTNEVIVGLGNLVSAMTQNALILDQNLTNGVFRSFSPERSDNSHLFLDKKNETLYLIQEQEYVTLTELIKTKLSPNSPPVISSMTTLTNNERHLIDHPIHNTGIALDDNFVYLYDGLRIEKRKKLNLQLVDTMVLEESPVPNPYPFYTASWGGIATDECHFLYIGYRDQIHKYDSNLNFISAISATDTVFGLSLRNAKTLYACGKNFIEQIDLFSISNHTITKLNGSGCDLCDGSASFVSNCPLSMDAYSYEWNTTPIQDGPTATNLCPGTYTLTIRDKSCNPRVIFQDSILIENQSEVLVIQSLVTTPASCTVDDGTASVEVIGGIIPYHYQWNTIPVQTNPLAVDLAAGILSVTIRDSMGCITIDSVLVPSQNNMQLNITGPVDICVADSTNVLVSVLGGTPPLTYLWSNGLDSPLASVQPGITYVEITDSVGCVSIDSVRIHQKPRIDFSTDTTKHCRPLANIFLNHTEPASVSVVWEFGDGTSSEQLDSVLHLYPITGYYDVTLTSKTEHCSDSLTKVAYVSVKENAHADFTVQSSSSKENSTLFLFTNQSTNASSYLWSFGDNSFDSIPTVAHLYPFEAGQYLVSLFANNAYNCSDSSTYTILILEKLLYYIPNAFTPDGNNLNDLFKPNFTAGFSPSHFSMSIYNRWGELIYESTDPDQGWDGTDHGRKVQGGIYVWDVQVKEKLSDKIHQYLGHVNLLR